LTQLWSRLPVENRRRALTVLGRIVAEQIDGVIPDGEPSPSPEGVQDPPALPGKGAGHENC